jgi:hypothetical protein
VAAGGADAALAIAFAGGYGLVTAEFGLPHALPEGFGLLHALVVAGAVVGALAVLMEADEEAAVAIAGGFTPSKRVSYGVNREKGSSHADFGAGASTADKVGKVELNPV